jgi:peptide/nickel transport system substrate-binding protein
VTSQRLEIASDSERPSGIAATTEGYTRRTLLKSAVAGGVALSTPSLLAACGSSSSSSASITGGVPRRGGTLRVAMVGGGATETLDPNAAVSNMDSARATNLFDRLVRARPDQSLEMELAESMEPNSSATAWTIRLRDGVEWHDGSPFVPEDLMYTLNRMGAKNSTLFGANVAAMIDLKAMKKLDKRTLVLPLLTPSAEFPALFEPPQMQIVKDGSKDFHHPIGTGPFKYVSFTPGVSSTFVRNPHYWKSGRPYVDKLVMLSIADAQARINALLTGQVDAIDQVPYPQAKAQMQSGSVTILNALGSSIVPMYMAVDLEPFRDVRVRQAMRLIANRPVLVANAQNGFGLVANDVFGYGQPDYDTQLPQRHQDIAQAKSLLKAAGKADLRVTLYSSTAAPGMLESATAFAEQAKAAGVTISVNNGPAGSYYGPSYLKQNFAQTDWPAFALYSWYQQALAPSAPFNETHWKDPEWDKLYLQAQATLDNTKRKELNFELQRILWERGGYLMWGFYPLLDGVGRNVHGAVANPNNELSNFNFRDFWLE